MTNIPPSFMAVENVTDNVDGSVSVFGRDHNGGPIMQTFPAGAVVAVIKGGAL